MLIAHKVALDPNKKQVTYFKKACGVARFAYNWALEKWKRQYKEHKIDPHIPLPSEAALRRELNSIKREQFPWMLEVTENAAQMAVIQLGKAFKNFFAGRARYPRFRKKGVHDRFTVTNDQFRVEGARMFIPKLGSVRMREPLRFSGKIMSATISRVADRWFASITVDTDDYQKLPANNRGAVGIDLGVAALATLSTGEVIIGPKPHTGLLQRLKRLSRRLSYKERGSSNWTKAKLKLGRIHMRITNIRLDSIHKFTSDIIRRFHTIGIEDLNVQGMMQNSYLARSLADMSFHEIKRQLAYKAEQRGGQVVIANRWFASSKICSQCGHKMKEMPLTVRSWACPICGARHDRDVNAAINLAKYAVSSTVSACGGEGSGSGGNTRVKPAPLKQEVSFVPI